MKQIPFNPELIGKPGITVKVDGEVPDFIKEYPNRNYPIIVVSSIGDASEAYKSNYEGLTMYRQTRSAEDIAKEVVDDYASKNKLSNLRYEFMCKHHLNIATALVQAGMDEMKGGEE